MLILLEFCSKNKKSNYYLYLLVFGYLQNLLKKLYYSKNKKTKFSVLKSPHIHKKAQQQLEENFYTKRCFFVLNDDKYLMLLKKLFNNNFQDCAIKYCFLSHTSVTFLNIKFLKLNYYKNKSKKINILFNYFRVLNAFGVKNSQTKYA